MFGSSTVQYSQETKAAWVMPTDRWMDKGAVQHAQHCSAVEESGTVPFTVTWMDTNCHTEPERGRRMPHLHSTWSPPDTKWPIYGTQQNRDRESDCLKAETSGAGQAGSGAQHMRIHDTQNRETQGPAADRGSLSQYAAMAPTERVRKRTHMFSSILAYHFLEEEMPNPLWYFAWWSHGQRSLHTSTVCCKSDNC